MRHRGWTTVFLLIVGLTASMQATRANESEHHSHKTRPTSTSGSSGSKTPTTQGFVTAAAQGGMAEVAIGRLAAERAQDPDVRQFAQHMVDDHSRANDELQRLAEQKHWKLPADMSSKQRMMLNRLHDKAGAEFDREYAKAMVQDHDHDVKMFERYSEHGKDAELKAWAAGTLPTLRDHQQMARSNAGKLGVSVASSMHDERK